MGYVNLTGVIAPLDPVNDTYPVFEDTFGLGGYRSVADDTERDAIPALRRKWGMKVYTISDGKSWILKDQGNGDLANNANWVDASSGGSFTSLSDAPSNYTNAKGQTLGRLATKIAVILKGKNKVDFAPHIDNGDYVIVLNADKFTVTGKKMSDKIYYRHTGYLG